MDFGITGLTEEQQQIKALVRQFCKKEVDVKRMKELADKAATGKSIEELREIQPVDLLEKLHNVGLRQLAVPVKYGGGGADYMTRAVACEEAGYSGGLVGPILSTTYMYCANLSREPVTDAQQDWFFSQFMSNFAINMAESNSEPHGNTDMHMGYDGPGSQMETAAYKDGNEWVINGNKMYCSAGGIADLIMVLVRTDKTVPITKGVSYFWVKKDSPGMTMESNRMLIDNIAGNVQILFDNVRVPELHLVGELNKGFYLKERSASTRMLPMLVMIGSAQKLYEQMRNYARERVQGGKPIIQHSMISNMLGEAAVGIESVRAYAYRASWENDQREQAGKPVNLFWTEGVRYALKKMSWRLCEIASEVYGGMASSLDMPVESFVRRTYRAFHTGGTAEMNAIMCSIAYDER